MLKWPIVNPLHYKNLALNSHPVSSNNKCKKVGWEAWTLICMKKYKQLSPEQRYIIALMIKQGKNKTSIVLEIGCSVSTVCREVKSNSTAKGYDANEAQKRRTLKHMIKPKQARFDWYQMLYIRSTLINDRYSPELISVMGKAVFGNFVSHETIYKWIWRSKQQYREDKHLYICLLYTSPSPRD